MPKTHLFNYFLYSSNNAVLEDSALWQRPLPSQRSGFNETHNEKADYPLRLGDYFESIRIFLVHQGLDSIVANVSKRSGLSISKDTIRIIDVYLEKHGEFYHPARIEVEIDGKKFSFVLNVAVSNAGNKLIHHEFELLQKLNRKVIPAFLPQAFCLGERQITNDKKITMFLGEWFDGFYEFHLSLDPKAEKIKLIVWAPEGNFFLSEKETSLLYRQVSKILTIYYSIGTSEQILSWHHAAGDFVVSSKGRTMDLRLITARHYGSMFMKHSGSGIKHKPGFILEALLLFLLHLSIRIRLDRIDGVGDIGWADTTAVENCTLGFYQGLKKKYHKGLQKGFAATFFNDYLFRFSKPVLYELCHSIVDRFYQNPFEIELIRNNLNDHIQILYSTIHHIAKSHKKFP